MTYIFDTLSVAGSFLPAFINDDNSGLNQDQIDRVQEFVRELESRISVYHEKFTFSFSTGLDSSFSRCEVCDFHADCYDVDVIVTAL
jgi:hypothetical protein